MAHATGVANNPTDLYNKLVAFLTTNPDLVAAGQEWTQVWNAPAGAANLTDKVLRGPGLSGQDQVYVGMRLTQRPATDAYWIELAGMTGILGAGVHYRDHVNVQPQYVRLLTDVGQVTYWFIANGRRFMVILKISTIFESCYCGLFLPYADPLSYPYPMFVAASSGEADRNGAAVNWRSTSDNHRAFPFGHWVNGGSQDATATDWIMSPAGEWQKCGNEGSGMPVILGPQNTQGNYHWSQNSSYSLGAWQLMDRLIEGYGGDRYLMPIQPIQTDPVDETYGVLDGAYRCQGIANAAENLITVDGVDHLVVQNTFRTGFSDYFAVELA